MTTVSDISHMSEEYQRAFADGYKEAKGLANAELAALRAENGRQRELLNTAVVKLDSCYQDYKKYRKQSERKDARIAQLEAALEFALAHLEELRDAWERGIISEHDGKGGIRSNRNVDAEIKIRAALKGARR